VSERDDDKPPASADGEAPRASSAPEASSPTPSAARPAPEQTATSGEIDTGPSPAPDAGDLAEAAPSAPASEQAPGEGERPRRLPRGERDASLPDVPPWADDLPSLAGVRHEVRDDPLEPPSRRRRLSRKAATYLAVGLIAVGLVGAFIGSSWANSRGYFLVCEPDSIRAERGRFWPWGRATMRGPSWQPIAISADTDCAELEVETEDQLAERFARALLARAGELLRQGETDDLPVAERQLEQALLLSRAQPGSSGREEVARLRGDLAYRRAVGELEAALERLDAAVTHFEDAAKRAPVHHDDAEARAAHARALVDATRRGPGQPIRVEGTGDRPAPTPGDPAPSGGLGRLPLGPDRPAADDDEAPASLGSDELEEDLPRGGVLL
jgi:hypothetical protein